MGKLLKPNNECCADKATPIRIPRVVKLLRIGGRANCRLLGLFLIVAIPVPQSALSQTLELKMEGIPLISRVLELSIDDVCNDVHRIADITALIPAQKADSIPNRASCLMSQSCS